MNRYLSINFELRIRCLSIALGTEIYFNVINTQETFKTEIELSSSPTIVLSVHTKKRNRLRETCALLCPLHHHSQKTDMETVCLPADEQASIFISFF